MAVVAVATLRGVEADDPINGSATFTADADIFIAGTTQWLTIGVPALSASFPGLDPGALTLKADINAAIKAFLIANGVTFGLLDTVVVI